MWKGSLNSKINYFTIVMLKNTIHCISLFIIYLLLFNFFILYIYILIMHILVMGSKVLNLWVQNTSTIILYIFYIKLEPRKICNCCVLTCFLSICILVYPIVYKIRVCIYMYKPKRLYILLIGKKLKGRKRCSIKCLYITK